jgi:hypothetical protein
MQTIIYAYRTPIRSDRPHGEFSPLGLEYVTQQSNKPSSLWRKGKDVPPDASAVYLAGPKHWQYTNRLVYPALAG